MAIRDSENTVYPASDSNRQSNSLETIVIPMSNIQPFSHCFSEGFTVRVFQVKKNNFQ